MPKKTRSTLLSALIAAALIFSAAPTSILSAASDAVSAAYGDTETMAEAPSAVVAEYGETISPAVKEESNAGQSFQPQDVPDTVAPVITAYSPADGTMTGPDVTFTADYYDPEPSSGIKMNTVMIHIDNRHQFETVVSPNRATCPKTGLTDGTHKIEAFVCDSVYNCSVIDWHITVDATAPVISDAEPTGTINTTGTNIAATFADGSGSGVNPATASVTIDGAPANPTCTINAAGVNCPVTGLADGSHSVSITVSDLMDNQAVKNWDFMVDTAAIGITNQEPADGTWHADASPMIKAVFHKASLGEIDPSKVSLTLDGADVSSTALCETGGFSYAPAHLSEGWHHVIVTAQDDAGHAGSSEWSFAVDTLPPLIKDETPLGTVSPQPTITAGFEDGGSGVDPTSASLIIDGVDSTQSATVDEYGISYAQTEPLAPGVHSAQLSIEDLTGNEQTSAWNFTVVQAPLATQPARPQNSSPASMTMVEYWQSYSSGYSAGGGGWTITGFQAFPNIYYLPWSGADPTAGQLTDEINIRNDGAGEAAVNIMIGGEIKWQDKVPEGEVKTHDITDTVGGPVKIACPTGQKLDVVHRITGDQSVNETHAVSQEYLEPVLLLPWFQAPQQGDGSSFVVMGNVGDQPAEVDLYVGDPQVLESLKGHFTIAPSSAAKAELKDIDEGPVRIVSTNDQPMIAAWEKITPGSAWETIASGLSSLGDHFALDMPDNQPVPSIYIGNSNDRDLQVEVRSSDQLMHDPDAPENDFIVIPSQGARALDLHEISGSEVDVVCTDCTLGEGLIFGAGR